MSPSSDARHERIRSTQACDHCREKKSKCDGAKPTCARCKLKSLTCNHSVGKRFKNQQVMRELANKLAQYENILQRNVAAQQQTSAAPHRWAEEASSEVAPASLPSHDSSSTGTSDIAALTSPSSSRSSDLNLSGRQSVDESSPSQTNSYLSDSLSYPRPALKQPNTWGKIWLYNNITLPPRSLLEETVNAFFQGSRTLFTLFDDGKIEAYLDEVYNNNHARPPPIVAVAQLCAVAAIGCQYCPHKTDPSTQTTLLSIVKLSLEDCVEQSSLLGMRLVTLLGMYYMFDTRTAALMYVETGLRLAKLNRTETEFTGHPSTCWQRCFTSLVFLDCWLCAMTGHLPYASNRELESSIMVLGTQKCAVDTVVQIEMLKLAMLTSSILENVDHTRFVSTKVVDNYKDRLQQWLLDLPDFMRLDALLHINSPFSGLRPMFVIHLLYMNTVILLYRRSLIELTDRGRQWPDDVQRFLEPCLWSGRQVSKILGIAFSQGQILQRCWIFTNITYYTCNVLLYFVANRLLRGDTSEQITHDINAAKQCIDVLGFCAEVDEVAWTYLQNTIGPYNDVVNLHQALVQKSTSDDSQLDTVSIYTQLRHIICNMAGLLTHPSEGDRPHDRGDKSGEATDPLPNTYGTPTSPRADRERSMSMASIAQEVMTSITHPTVNDSSCQPQPLARDTKA